MLGPEVMLASSSGSSVADLTISQLQAQGHWFEIKFDGIRAVATMTGSSVRLTNRRQADITYRYPDVVEQLAGLGVEGVIDGEIIVPGRDGRPDFPLAHLRDAQSSAKGVRAAVLKAPAMFMPFDVLEAGGRTVRALTYVQRHEVLADTFAPGTFSVASQDGATLWSFVQQRSLEGLVAKRGDSAYRPGRSKAWTKIKATKRVSALVCGVAPGKGSRGAIGSLRLCLWNPQTNELVGIGAVGSGLSYGVLSAMPGLLEAGPVVVEVEYLEVSPSGQLRMPIFRGIRQDIDPATCVVDSLGVSQAQAG